MSKLQALLTGLFFGLVIGIVGAFVQADRMKLGNSVIPYGVFLVASIVPLCQIWLTRHFQSRIAAISIAIGWAAATQLMGQSLSWNSQIIVDSWWSKVYVPATAILAGIACSLPPFRPVEIFEEFPDAFTATMPAQEFPPTLDSDKNE